MADDARREPTESIEGRWERETVGEYVRTTVHVDRPCRPRVAAPHEQPRCEENRGGDFYTACQQCLTGDVPHLVAPDLMAYVEHPEDGGHAHCVFTRQPRTPDEIDRAIEAICQTEICGIRYAGTDPGILQRIRDGGGEADAWTPRALPAAASPEGRPEVACGTRRWRSCSAGRSRG